jgi:hypothetical protein
MKKDKEMRMREKMRASMGRVTLSFSHFLDEYLCYSFFHFGKKKINKKK